MKPFFKELFDYNQHCNKQLIEKSLEFETEISEKTKKLFNHILNAHEIWNSRILQQKPTFGVWQIHPIQRWKTTNQSNFEASLSILDGKEIDLKVNYTNSKGDAFRNSIQDILFHIINHSNYHRAQIAADFRANNIEPLTTDYIFYKR